MSGKDARPDEASLRADRDLRDEARAIMLARFNRLKSGLEERGLGQRVADHAMYRARAVAGEAIEVANDSRGVVIGTLAVLAAWLLRKPLMKKAQQLWPDAPGMWLKGWQAMRADDRPGESE